jgi:hypothetical protein
MASRFRCCSGCADDGTGFASENFTVAGRLGVTRSDAGRGISGALGCGARAFFAGLLRALLRATTSGAMGGQTLVDFLFPCGGCRRLFV